MWETLFVSMVTHTGAMVSPNDEHIDDDTSRAASVEFARVSRHHGQGAHQVRALRELDLVIRPGEIVGLLGPNGAGKTTLMKLLCGFYAPTSSEHARVLGLDLTHHPERIRARTGYLPEHVPLHEEMLVYDAITFAGRLYGLRGRALRGRIEAVLEELDLSSVVGVKCQELSKGYRQRVGLAQALVHEPELLVLDEPSTGLDPNQVLDLRDLLRRIGKTRTIVFSTHIMQEVAAVCDRLLLLHEGALRLDTTLDALCARVEETDRGALGPHLERLFKELTRHIDEVQA